MKKCTRCGLLKNREDFYKFKKSLDGLKWACKKCVLEQNQVPKDFILVSEKICRKCGKIKPSSFFAKSSVEADRLQKWCKLCRKEHYDTNARKVFFNHVERMYGLTKEQYIKMVADQKECCAICGLQTKLHVDHDHNTGKVRELLCSACNTSLGSVKDNSEILKSMIEYLKKHKSDTAFVAGVGEN
jgi:hypothetical protein